MSSEEAAGWITAIGLAVAGVAAATWGVLQKIRAGRLELKTAEEVSNAQTAARIKMDSAEAAKMRAEAERQKEKERAEHYERIIKRTEAQLDKQYKRLDDLTEEIEAVRQEHTTCREELATERERGRNQGHQIARQEERIALLEKRLALLENTDAPSS